MAELYKMYWYPLYAYVRSRGNGAEDAADLVQGFFTKLMDGGTLLRSADPVKGRFRSYLLGAVKHFMANEWDKANAHKRGGKAVRIALDDAERRYEREPAHELTPERLFERRWALTLLERVMHQLREEHVASGKLKQFELLKDLLAGPLADRSYGEIGAELGMSEGAVKVAVHRLRQRYRELLSNQIAETVASQEDIADEIKHLHEALAGNA
jgi:RNA polymerase sigma factor (sigma-70 family)